MNDYVEFGKIPGVLIKGWNGSVYYYKTSLDERTHEQHRNLVQPIIDKQMSDSYDHGSEWREEKIELVIWKKWHQVTLVQFRIKDTY